MGGLQALLLQIVPLAPSLLSFCHFQDLYDVDTVSPNGDSQISLALVAFPQSFSFIFLGLDHFKCLVFKVTDSSACSSLPLNPFSEFFISIMVIFSSRMSFLFPFRFSISLRIWSFYFTFCLLGLLHIFSLILSASVR